MIGFYPRSRQICEVNTASVGTNSKSRGNKYELHRSSGMVRCVTAVSARCRVHADKWPKVPGSGQTATLHPLGYSFHKNDTFSCLATNPSPPSIQPKKIPNIWWNVSSYVTAITIKQSLVLCCRDLPTPN